MAKNDLLITLAVVGIGAVAVWWLVKDHLPIGGALGGLGPSGSWIAGSPPVGAHTKAYGDDY